MCGIKLELSSQPPLRSRAGPGWSETKAEKVAHFQL